MKPIIAAALAALLATQAAAVVDVDANQDDGCSGCTNEPGGWGEPEPAPEPEPTPEPAPSAPNQAEDGDFMRPDENGNWITGSINYGCRNEPICADEYEGGRR